MRLHQVPLLTAPRAAAGPCRWSRAAAPAAPGAPPGQLPAPAGGRGPLHQVRLLTASRHPLAPAWPRWTRECFVVEIFEIYCKIQNRLIFIMRIKTFFCIWKKIEMCGPQLPRRWRSAKGRNLEASGQGWDPRWLGFVPVTCRGQTSTCPREPRAAGRT